MTAEDACFGPRQYEKISEDFLSVDEYEPLVICKCQQLNTAISTRDRIKRETGEAYTAAIVRPCRVVRAEDNIGKRKVCDDIVLIRKTEYTTINQIATIENYLQETIYKMCVGVTKLCDALST